MGALSLFLYHRPRYKLWQDLEAFIETKKNDTYFFGSIIINNDSEELYVIDGQQRMTTFILLLKALLIKINEVLPKIPNDADSELLKVALETRRTKIIGCLYSIDDDQIPLVTRGLKTLESLPIKYKNKSINEEYPDEIHAILKGSTYYEIEQDVKKIKYRQRDNKYTNFFRNLKYFKEKLDNFDSTKVNEFAKSLLEKCQVIVVISYQTEEAIEIFNSLNSTGMPLADADILIAKLYSNYIGDKKEFNNTWSEVVKNTNLLSSQKISTIDDILNQYMYILRAKRQEKDTTMPGVRRYFTSINKDALINPDIFVDDIKKIVDIWQSDKLTDELDTLRALLFKHNNNFRFFFITYFFFNNDKTDSEKILFTESLLKLFALLSIKEYGYSSAKFKSFLIGLNMDIGAGIETDILVNKINLHIQKEFGENDILNSIMTTNVDNCIVFLNEYLYAKENNITLNLNVPKIEIEHIMPSSGKNIDSIREDAKMDEEEFYQSVNKIGNKILLEQNINGSISNDWFKIKKQTSVDVKRGYKDSTFEIAKSLVNYPKDKWEKVDIDIATQTSAKRIVNFIFSK